MTKEGVTGERVTDALGTAGPVRRSRVPPPSHRSRTSSGPRTRTSRRRSSSPTSAGRHPRPPERGRCPDLGTPRAQPATQRSIDRIRLPAGDRRPAPPRQTTRWVPARRASSPPARSATRRYPPARAQGESRRDRRRAHTRWSTLDRASAAGHRCGRLRRRVRCGGSADPAERRRLRAGTPHAHRWDAGRAARRSGRPPEGPRSRPWGSDCAGRRRCRPRASTARWRGDGGRRLVDRDGGPGSARSRADYQPAHRGDGVPRHDACGRERPRGHRRAVGRRRGLLPGACDGVVRHRCRGRPVGDGPAAGPHAWRPVGPQHVHDGWSAVRRLRLGYVASLGAARYGPPQPARGARTRSSRDVGQLLCVDYWRRPEVVEALSVPRGAGERPRTRLAWRRSPRAGGQAGWRARSTAACE